MINLMGYYGPSVIVDNNKINNVNKLINKYNKKVGNILNDTNRIKYFNKIQNKINKILN